MFRFDSVAICLMRVQTNCPRKRRMIFNVDCRIPKPKSLFWWLRVVTSCGHPPNTRAYRVSCPLLPTWHPRSGFDRFGANTMTPSFTDTAS